MGDSIKNLKSNPSLSPEEIVSDLQSNGFGFKILDFSTEGHYLPEDADWNYRDLLHMKHFHGVEFLSIGGDGNFNTAIWKRSLFGLSFPVVVTSVRLSGDEHMGITACFGFTIVSRDVFERTGEQRCRVNTRYFVGAPWWLVWLRPTVSKWIASAYRRLHAEDRHMRERRGQLRAWGFRFLSDRDGSDFIATNNLAIHQVRPPAGIQEKIQVEWSIASLFKGRKTFLWGRSDHEGLRFELLDDRIEIYPRLCRHAGASLDDAQCNKSTLQCPWHGMRISTLAILPLYQANPVSALYQDLNFTLAGDRLSIETVSAKIQKPKPREGAVAKYNTGLMPETLEGERQP